MKLKLDIDPDIVAMMAGEVAAGERAATAAIREARTEVPLVS
jgi:ADP-ribose pyrophosphatase YjhB (NUDIX family)